ncbi:MAG: glycosyltransferase [Pseudomonadota bacterium]
MMSGKIKRILVYTHDSIGLGHAFRTLALITGIKKWRPDIDFLVLSCTPVPQIFFDQGIEVVKLPSIKLDIDHNDTMKCRYLEDFDLESIFDFRQRIILATYDFFKPDALMVEHNMTGQMSELIPVLMKKWIRKGGPADFALVHVCRGIMRWVPLLTIPYENPRHRSESINIGELYDFMYVLEDREIIDINQAFLGNDPKLEPKIHYLGKITSKVVGELAPRREVLDRFGLYDAKTIVISMGRNSKVPELSLKLLELLTRAGLCDSHQVVVILDPYIDRETAQAIREKDFGGKVKFRPFIPSLVDLVNQAELVISRAGYNTVNELLLTGTRAVLIPEPHGSGEQEMRVRSLSSSEDILMFTEDDILSRDVTEEVLGLMSRRPFRKPCELDKYAIGKSIIDDLERWMSSNRSTCVC